MFISPAYAQSLGFLGDTSSLMQMAPLVLIFVVFYFFLIRPQQTKAKQHRSMLDALRRGDRVVTGGGIIGTVTKVQNDQEVTVEIADNVRVRVLRSTITSVLAKTEPVAAKEGAKDEEKTPEPAAANAGPEDSKLMSGLKRLIGGK
ncbi:MAG TPA: preprotein translocase subunit YajC [Stellaceae bacterium]|nr:preprotein translocase subunit YajC [Stellaceae bacterium]